MPDGDPENDIVAQAAQWGGSAFQRAREHWDIGARGPDGGDTADGGGATTAAQPAQAQDPNAQERQEGLIQAIMDGDHETVDQQLDFFGRIAAQFGMSELFDKLKGFIYGIMGGDEAPTEDQIQHVRDTTGAIIDAANTHEIEAPGANR